MKVLNIVLRILLALLLVTPILGVTGVFPAPTANLYTESGWAFMSALIASGYILPLIAVLCFVCIILLALNKTALAAVLLAPFSINVILFHAVVDTGLWSPNASLGIALFLLNAYFLWVNRKEYQRLW